MSIIDDLIEKIAGSKKSEKKSSGMSSENKSSLAIEIPDKYREPTESELEKIVQDKKQMPFYHQDCAECGDHTDVLRSVKDYKVCFKCGGPCEVLLYPVRTVGIIFSNAEEHSQLGVRWETNKQKREWEKSHPNAVPMSKGSPEEKNFNDRIKNQMHDTLKKQGFTHKEFKQKCSEQKRRTDLGTGKAEKKICVT